MTVSMFDASVPVFQKRLGALDTILNKAVAFATARKIDESTLLMARLYPDMLPMWRQVTIACDFAKGAGARLAGAELPKYEDDEKSFSELSARIKKTTDFLATLDADQFEGSAARDVIMPIAGKPMIFKGDVYLLHVAMPNFYFHLTTAYAILRHNGLEVGKNDFMGR